MDLSPLHFTFAFMATLGAKRMVDAWEMHRYKVPEAPSVIGLAACMYFMFAAKDYVIDTFRALLRFGLIDMGPQLGW